MSAIRFLILSLFMVASATWAQTYPDKSRPIHFVAPFGAGSGVDLVLRAYARALGEQAGINAIVDNKPDADGVIGVEFAKNAAPTATPCC